MVESRLAGAKDGAMQNLRRLYRRFAPAIAGYEQVLALGGMGEPFRLSGMRFQFQELAAEQHRIGDGSSPAIVFFDAHDIIPLLRISTKPSLTPAPLSQWERGWG